MATHFAPLVYLTALTAWLVHELRRAGGQVPAPWILALFFIAAFFGGGFSEPPDAMWIVGTLLALLAVRNWVKGPHRRAALSLLAWTFAGGVLALLVMMFSPANAFRLGTPPPNFPTLIYRTLLYSVQFIVDSLATLPLAMLMSAAMSLALFYCLFALEAGLSIAQRRTLLIVVVATPLLMYILIAASFAPSVYGQAYPVERARFAGRLMMTTATILEGALLGVLLAQWRHMPAPSGTVILANVLLAISTLYPLRGAESVLRANLSDFRQWSAAWDARQAQILADKAQGERDIVVPQLPGVEHVKELDTRPEFWVNRCAAVFYGVGSISAPQGYP